MLPAVRDAGDGGLSTRPARGSRPRAARSCRPPSAVFPRGGCPTPPALDRAWFPRACDHVTQEAVCRDRQGENVAVASPTRRRGRVGRMNRAASRLGVKARKSCSPTARRADSATRLRRAAGQATTIGSVRTATGPAAPDAIAVRARASGVARMKAPVGTSSASTTATSSGRQVFTASAARSGCGPPSTRTLATCPVHERRRPSALRRPARPSEEHGGQRLAEDPLDRATPGCRPSRRIPSRRTRA